MEMLEAILPQDINQNSLLVKYLEEELWKRNILCSDEEDQLRWGRRDGGEFTLKEARHYIVGHDYRDLEPHWERLCNLPQWSKIKTFMWLVLHKKILSWENLVKRGFNGPSRCHLYEGQEETINHMLYGFPYTTDLWDWVAILYHQTDRVREDILATLRNWRVQYTENEIVNLCWGLTLGFVNWEIWKERNRTIFHNESLPIIKLIESIKNQLRETIPNRNLHSSTKNPSSQELQVLQILQLDTQSFSLPVH